MNNPAYSKKHWLVFVSVAMMMGASLGLLTNGNGVFYVPMAEDLGLYIGTISLHNTFKSFATAFAALTVPYAVKLMGLKASLAIGAVFGVVGTIMMSFISNELMIYILGVVRGFGTAYLSLVPMAMILNLWFDKHNGLVFGLASGASGVMGALSAPILTMAINSMGWRMAFVLKAGMILILALPVILLPFKLDPRDEGLLPYGFEEAKASKDPQNKTVTAISAGTAVLVALIFISFLNTFVMYMNSHFPAFGQSVGLLPQTASLMLSGAMVGNLVWKAVYGFLSDRIGAVNSALVMVTVNFIALILMIFSNHAWVLILASFLFGGAFAISGVALAVLCRHFYGPLKGGEVYSRVNFFASFGGAFGVAAAGFIYDFSGSYVPAFILASAFSFMNGLLLIGAQRNYQTKQAKAREKLES